MRQYRMRGFRRRLIDKQDSERLSGQQMAARLGVSESHWSHIRAERRDLTLEMVHRALSAFPDLVVPFIHEATAEQQSLTAKAV